MPGLDEIKEKVDKALNGGNPGSNGTQTDTSDTQTGSTGTETGGTGTETGSTGTETGSTGTEIGSTGTEIGGTGTGTGGTGTGTGGTSTETGGTGTDTINTDTDNSDSDNEEEPVDDNVNWDNEETEKETEPAKETEAPRQEEETKKDETTGKDTGKDTGRDSADPMRVAPGEEIALDPNRNDDTSASAAEVFTVPAEETLTTAETQVPGGDEPAAGFLSGGGLLYAALALLLALIVCVALVIIRKNNAEKKRRQRRRARRAGSRDDLITTRGVDPTLANAPMAAAPAAAQQPIVAAVHQHIGAREDQQDSYGASDLTAYPTSGVLAVVADGMGGLSNGGAVSSALVRTFLEGFRHMAGQTQPQDMLLEMAIQANNYINQMLRGAERSGSTLVSAVVQDGYLHFLTVGDSRIYLYRAGTLLQLNREHIYQEELAVKAINRLISIPQVSGDRQAHSLTSYFGIGSIPAIDRNYEGIKLVPGDRILLATDGVFGTLSREEMEQALQGTVGEATQALGDRIREIDKPYQDNNTALILEYRG